MADLQQYNETGEVGFLFVADDHNDIYFYFNYFRGFGISSGKCELIVLC